MKNVIEVKIHNKLLGFNYNLYFNDLQQWNGLTRDIALHTVHAGKNPLGEVQGERKDHSIHPLIDWSINLPMV